MFCSAYSFVRANPNGKVSIQTHMWVDEGEHYRFAAVECAFPLLPWRLVGIDDAACHCTVDGISGGVNVTYAFCADHFHEGVLPWCFVKGGSLCAKARPSVVSRGAAWLECISSQCACTTSGMSGSVNVSAHVGCQDRSAQGLRSFCYVAGGEKCATIVSGDTVSPLDVTASLSFGDQNLSAGEPAAAFRTCVAEACQCTKTGLSGGVVVEAIGCADHFHEDKVPW
jgi:hypothetical protein